MVGCSYPGCVKLSRNKIEPGYCSCHRSRIERHGSPDIVLRSSPLQPFCSLTQRKKSKGTWYWVTIVKREQVYVHRNVAVAMQKQQVRHLSELLHSLCSFKKQRVPVEGRNTVLGAQTEKQMIVECRIRR